MGNVRIATGMRARELVEEGGQVRHAGHAVSEEVGRTAVGMFWLTSSERVQSSVRLTWCSKQREQAHFHPPIKLPSAAATFSTTTLPLLALPCRSAPPSTPVALQPPLLHPSPPSALTAMLP